MSGLGAICGAAAAFVAYEFRTPEKLDELSLKTTVSIDAITLSDELWAIVGLMLLGLLVCGSVSAAYVVRKGPPRMLIAGLVGGSLGAVLCWAARGLMDLIIYSFARGAAEIPLANARPMLFLSWLVWQAGVALALTMPVVLAIGPTRFTLFRGLLGAALVVVLGEVIGMALGFLLVLFVIGSAVSGGGPGGDMLGYLRVMDVIYLFTLGAAAGIAFGVAEALYKPAWLKSRSGPTEGRSWTLQGPTARIGSMEGVEVFLPFDQVTAPIHAQIHAQEDAHYLVDLVGGLLVNGAPTANAWLKDGDVHNDREPPAHLPHPLIFSTLRSAGSGHRASDRSLARLLRPPRPPRKRARTPAGKPDRGARSHVRHSAAMGAQRVPQARRADCARGQSVREGSRLDERHSHQRGASHERAAHRGGRQAKAGPVRAYAAASARAGLALADSSGSRKIRTQCSGALP
jgi:MFS family permease